MVYSSQLSFEIDLVISELVESASAATDSTSCWFPELLGGTTEVGGASVEGEVASIVGRFIGFFEEDSSPSLTGADLLRTLSYMYKMQIEVSHTRTLVTEKKKKTEKCIWVRGGTSERQNRGGEERGQGRRGTGERRRVRGVEGREERGHESKGGTWRVDVRELERRELQVFVVDVTHSF